jgi:hypothetical protein
VHVPGACRAAPFPLHRHLLREEAIHRDRAIADEPGSVQGAAVLIGRRVPEIIAGDRGATFTKA